MSTQIRGNKQIKNITIENDQIIDSTIELNKLKEGAELFKRDGSVAATDNLNLDGNQIKNIGAPIDDNDAIRKVDLDELADRVGGTLINREIVGGVKDGENVTFTLANEPTLATEQIFLNGSLLNAGANADYSIAGNVITFTVAPQEGDAILANYIVDGIQLNVDVQATLAAFNGRLTTAEAELFDTEQAVVELGNDADILAGRVTTTENEISAVKVRATNIENNIDVVEADLSAEEARAMGAESALDARVGEAEIDIVGLTNRMLSAEGDINSLEAADVAMDSRVGNLEDGLQAETTARTTADNALNTRVTALENADTDVDARLDAVESDVAALEVDISSEAATRLANDNALQSNINGEIAARSAADSTLQSNINQEIANRIADVDAEEARAMAAESALNVRVTALEADPASQAYVDQKISDLVNSAPAVLDTLKELSDALGGDQNFATTISNQIGNVASNLSSEISRAQNAEAALDARIDEIDVNLAADYASIAYVDAEVSAVDYKVDSLVADLAQEAIDRAADVDAEEARAMSAESALDARIETLENAPAPVTALSYLSDVTVTTPSNGQVLQYNGSEWVNGAAPSTFSGSYNDLTNKPALVQVAFSGSYNDLIQKPNFADVATSGSYADLNSKPDLSVYALDSDLSAVDARVTNVETNKLNSSVYDAKLALVDAKDSEQDERLTSVESNKVEVSAYNTTIARIDAKDATQDALIATKANTSSLSTVATSGSYNDLSDKPSIPSITGLATESYVDTAVSGLVNGAPAVLDTLKELSDALGADENFATTVAGQIGDVAGDVSALDTRVTSAEGNISDLQSDLALKADANSLATVATSGSYTDLTNKPSLFSGSYDDLSNKPSLVSAINDLSDVTITSPSVNQILKYDGSGWINSAAPATFSGSYSDLTDKPTLASFTTLTSPASGEFLKYNGSAWVNSALPEASATVSGIINTGSQTIKGNKSLDASVWTMWPAAGNTSYMSFAANYSPMYVGKINGQHQIDALSTGSTLQLKTDSIVAIHIGSNPADYKAGKVGIATTSPVAQLDVRTVRVGDKGFVVRGMASQTANLFEVQDSSGTAISTISASGDVYHTSTSTSGIPLSITRPASPTNYGFVVRHSNGKRMFGVGANATLAGEIGGWGSYVEMGNDDYAMTRLGYHTSTGAFRILSNTDTIQSWESPGGSAGVYTLSIARNATNTSLEYTPSGFATSVNFATNLGVNLSSPAVAQFQVNSFSASKKAMIVRGAASQTANLFEAQNSSGTAIFSVDKDGSMSAGIVPVARVSGLAQVATSGSYDDLSNKPSLFSGSYTDLTNKPAIPTPTREVPSGSVNGTNVTFTLSQSPSVANTEQVFLNGLLQFAGASDDYTISGNTITFNSAPEADWKLVVYYFV